MRRYRYTVTPVEASRGASLVAQRAACPEGKSWGKRDAAEAAGRKAVAASSGGLPEGAVRVDVVEVVEAGEAL